MDDKTFENNIVIIIRPSLKRACCEGNACRAAILNQLLYSIAWKLTYGSDYWYGSYEEIYTKLLDESWGLSKVIKETKTLIAQGFIEQRRNPDKGWDQTRQYLFGEEQAKKFREACKKAGISCIEHQMGFPPDVIHLLKITNAISKNDKCNCQIQQIDSANSTNASVKNNDAIPKTTTKERKNDATQQKSNAPAEEDSSHSSNQSSPLVEFTEEEERVYELAKKLKLSFLKKNEKNKAHCAKLLSEGVTTSEQMESLMQFCRQRSYLVGKDLNLGNLAGELDSWLQVQQSQASGRVLSSYDDPDYVDDTFYVTRVTDEELAEDVRNKVHAFREDDRFDLYLQEIKQIKAQFSLTNFDLCNLMANTCRKVTPENSGMNDFIHELQRLMY